LDFGSITEGLEAEYLDFLELEQMHLCGRGLGISRLLV
jgi:hypothetical protein